MCGIVGVMRSGRFAYGAECEDIINYNSLRGFDGYGVVGKSRTEHSVSMKKNFDGTNAAQIVSDFIKIFDMFLVNFRAHPLPEMPSDNSDKIQPFFEDGRTFVVHNGTISNDTDLINKYKFSNIMVDSQVIAKLYNHNMNISKNNLKYAIERTCKELEGGFACILYDLILQKVIVIKNYKTLYIHYDPGNIVSICSEIPPSQKYNYVMVPAYTALIINPLNLTIEDEFTIQNTYASKHIPDLNEKRCVAVCSGGMDSSLAAFLAKKVGNLDDMTILNFNYGQRGWMGEKQAARNVAKALDAEFAFVDMRPLFDNLAKTPLTDYSLDVTMGLRSAEAGTEWVPVRNLILLSAGAGYAESIGAKYIVYGGNLEEEASCYSDNDAEFIATSRLAIERGSLKGIKLLNMVSRLMKRDIVTLGTALGVPLEGTLSCYDPSQISDLDESKYKNQIRAAKKNNFTYTPCGRCGCCAIRRHAFKLARIKDPQEDMYLHPIEKFPTWDIYEKKVEELGYIKPTKEWADEILKKYQTRIPKIR